MKQRMAKQVISMLPQNAISKAAGALGRSKMSRLAIKPYAKLYDIDLSQIEKPVHHYKHLTEFFTRKLQAGARPIANGEKTIVSPVDGTVAQLGFITEGAMIQAKGIDYSVEALLGDRVAHFQNGSFITIYLSPRDYHRIHMPLAGYITSSTYIPGRLFPVNEIGVNHVQGLFTKNERLITYANTTAGEVAIVKVGAFIVGSVKVGYNEAFKQGGRDVVKTTHEATHVEKGQELGLFEFGSTVILLFEEGKMTLNHTLKPGSIVKMGEAIGTITT
ncbi:phosphatidylserine decarboxylase [Fictibacillus macauensis ZFHKF-1]|uniref:Phosphatidylserine decarboxylase proenzyme n=1 Tax=Fictibacillus macauensis ZFHKF-1 TaxID=1196324 RepID=I8AMF5_9BACL|nr:archaetidylserine decarboxylase [Fictibacillus macauensis]EIT86859.1 phosphatidylserine decarboxylase [Fictibacillus macauensis ZFHKF-1]